MNCLLIINCVILTIGTCGGPLLTRLYYTNGGQRIWFMSFLSTAGFPVILIPLFFSYLRRNRNNSETAEKTKLILMETPLFIASIVIGLLIGLDNYLFSYGLAYVPVSTSSLIIGTQLAFNALFAFFMVKQKFTPFSINAVVLLTVGTAVLALHSNGDKPAYETHKEYVVGFLMTVIAAVLYAFILPLVELTYKKARQEITFPLVLEIQMVMCIAATCFCVVGMIIDGDFKVISREATDFKIGGSAFYYTLIVITGIVWQALLLGVIGVVFCASSLTSGVLISVLLPVTEILAVICFREKFQAGKGVALFLSLWGFVSYFYGEYTSGKNVLEKHQEMGNMEGPMLTRLYYIEGGTRIWLILSFLATAGCPIILIPLYVSLVFNAIFAFLMVKQKFTPFSINAVDLLTVSAGILALHADGRRRAG